MNDPTKTADQITIEYVLIAEIKNNANNARVHSRKQIEKLQRGIKKFGFLVPVLINDDGVLLAGHARVEAAGLAGITSVPAIRASHLNAAEQRAYMLADNRLAELAVWDNQALGRELQFLSELDIDFDFSAIGFDTPEVDFHLGNAIQPTSRDDALPASLPSQPAVTMSGYLWILGEHVVYCGDALDPSSYEALLGSDRAQMVFSDPPYNVPIHGHVGGLGATQHREFAMAAGEMTSDQFTAFLTATFQQVAKFSADGAIVYICMDWRHAHEILRAGEVFSQLKNICVWVKNNGGMGSLYRSQHEFIFVFKNGNGEHINNVELGKHGRNRTNIWEYPGLNSFGNDRDALLKIHPTVKPVALVADAIKDCSRRGDLILDQFGGSGTTIIAAEKTQRRARVIEIDPLYVDAIIRRWQAYTGKTAVCVKTNASFEDTEALRKSSDETESTAKRTAVEEASS